MTLTTQQRETRKAAHNTRLASCGVKCLYSSSVLQLGFSARLTVLCSEIPHERQAQKRCVQHIFRTYAESFSPIFSERNLLKLLPKNFA